MKLKSVTALAVLVSAMAAGVAADEPLSFPQTRAATYDEIRAYQALGRIVTAPDGSFFLYEWSRPYNWAPDVSWLAAAPGARTQTWLYRVDTTTWPTTSKYAFFQDPNSSYYLGSLSPNSQRASFYRINHDDKVVKAGVVTFDDAIRPTITYFASAPDDSKLTLPPVWTSNDELIYPVKSGDTKLVRANATNGETQPCTDCSAGMIETAAAAAEQAAKVRVAQKQKRPEKKASDTTWGTPQNTATPPKNARELVRSETGDLSIYCVDNAEVLTLLFIKNGEALRTLFENERKPSKVVSSGKE